MARRSGWQVGKCVDGLQRLSTVLSFFGKLQGHKSSENHWQMGAGILFRSDAKSVDDSPPESFKLKHQEKPVRIEVVKWDSKYRHAGIGTLQSL